MCVRVRRGIRGRARVHVGRFTPKCVVTARLVSATAPSRSSRTFQRSSARRGCVVTGVKSERPESAPSPSTSTIRMCDVPSTWTLSGRNRDPARLLFSLRVFQLQFCMYEGRITSCVKELLLNNSSASHISTFTVTQVPVVAFGETSEKS